MLGLKIRVSKDDELTANEKAIELATDIGQSYSRSINESGRGLKISIPKLGKKVSFNDLQLVTIYIISPVVVMIEV